MKRYLYFSIALILGIAGWFLLRDRFSLWFDWQGREAQTQACGFVVEGKEIFRIFDEEKEAFEIRGISLDSSLPGHFATDFAVSGGQYLEWFDLIAQMGANTVRVPTIMDSGFYDAFYEFNAGREEPLYLIQALWVTDYAQDSHEDALGGDFFGQLKKDALTAVDVIHGHAFLAYAKTRGNGWYTKDISQWVLGITLGTSWRGETTAYTNHMREEEPYTGRYYSASQDAGRFESMLAELLDVLTVYESRKYQKQHLLSVVSEPATDPFDYEWLIKAQTGKCDRIDASHILSSEDVKAGFYVSYRFYDFCPDILSYLTPEEKVRLDGILAQIQGKEDYSAYLELLERYHEIPVVIGDYGFSSSRGITRAVDGKCGLNEKEQGEKLMELYQTCRGLGLSGVVISSWQDGWYRTDWNVYPMIDKERGPFWHNVQSESQGYGLLAFDPGVEGEEVVLDGCGDEWEGYEPLIDNGFGRLSCRQDEAYLYLLVERKDERRLYIPFDITPKSGSTYYGREGVKFEGGADFLLVIDGKEQARLLVHPYYDPWWAAWLQHIEHKDAYTVELPDANEDDFVQMRMILKDDPWLSQDWSKRNAPVFDTGMLHYGNGDPDAPDFDSRADFCSRGNMTEIRIPWQLLNFSDPSAGKIHDDYYKHFGIEARSTDSISLGLGGKEDGSLRIGFEVFELKLWDRTVSYHQRLKQSYYVVRECWSGKQR